jgi:hypothetical protein
MEYPFADPFTVLDADDRNGALPPNSWRLPRPAGARTKVGASLHLGGSRRRIERRLAPSLQSWGNAIAQNQASAQPPGPGIAIVGIGMAAESFFPWALIWSSDIFLFDVPAWSLWLVFGGPLTFTILALIVYWASRTHPLRVSRAMVGAGRQGQRGSKGGDGR